MTVSTIAYIRTNKENKSKQNLKKPNLLSPCVNDSSISEHLSMLSRPLPPPTSCPAAPQPGVQLIKLPASCCERRQQVQRLQAPLINAAHFTGTTCRPERSVCETTHYHPISATPCRAPATPTTPPDFHYTFSLFLRTSSQTVAVRAFQASLCLITTLRI